RKYSSTQLVGDTAHPLAGWPPAYKMWPRSGCASLTGRSFAIVNSIGRRRAGPFSVIRYGYFAATNGFTSILAVNIAPPTHASRPGQAVVTGGKRNKRTGYAFEIYLFPGGPPPPLQVHG